MNFGLLFTFTFSTETGIHIGTTAISSIKGTSSIIVEIIADSISFPGLISTTRSRSRCRGGGRGRSRWRGRWSSSFHVRFDPSQVLGDFSIDTRVLSSGATNTKTDNTSDDRFAIFHADKGST